MPNYQLQLTWAAVLGRCDMMASSVARQNNWAVARRTRIRFYRVFYPVMHEVIQDLG